MLKNLRMLIERTGLSPTDVASKSKLSLRSIHAYLSNQAKPSLESAIKIADVFNVSLDFLCGRETENRSDSDYI